MKDEQIFDKTSKFKVHLTFFGLASKGLRPPTY